MLHIVSASPFQDSALRECLAIAQPGDALLLLADAVYATQMEKTAFSGLSVFTLLEHLKTRGLAAPNWLQTLDSDGMVQITCQFHPVKTWS